MATSKLNGVKLKGVSSCVPEHVFDTLQDSKGFDSEELQKFVSMVGIEQRRIVDDKTCASDLCLRAAQELLDKLNWDVETIEALVLVSITPDYILPNTANLIHRDLNLPESCAAFDVNLGCSGYPYGLWLASMMVQTGSAKRVLIIHGDTPSQFVHPDDRATALLFGDVGTATAIEADAECDDNWGFSLHTDGKGYADLIVPGGGNRNPNPEDDRDNYVYMNGTNIFCFAAKKVPALINDTLAFMDMTTEEMDAFIFHQSNQFMMKFIADKQKIPLEKIPIYISKYGNTGGASVPLTLSLHYRDNPAKEKQQAMLLGYGVGLSWSSALLTVYPDAVFLHSEYS